MRIRAFNLVPGLVVYYKDEGLGFKTHPIVRVERNAELEVVYGRYDSGLPFSFDYNDEVLVVGSMPLDASEDGLRELDMGRDFVDPEQPLLRDKARLAVVAATGVHAVDFNEAQQRLVRILTDYLVLSDESALNEIISLG
jgi:hypothetical protein